MITTTIVILNDLHARNLLMSGWFRSAEIPLQERMNEFTLHTYAGNGRSMSMENRIMQLNRYLIGWIGYFRLASAKGHCEKFDQWNPRRLRMCLWKQWKRVRTRIRELRALGVPEWACFVMANSDAERGKCLET